MSRRRAARRPAATDETTAADVARMVAEPSNRQPVEVLSGTAAIYAPAAPRASSSYVPLSGHVPAPEEPPPSLPDAIHDPEGRASAADQILPSALALNPQLLANVGALGSLLQPASHSLRPGC